MFYNFLIVLLVIDALVLVTAILLQAGKGSGLSANFGGASSSPDAFIGIRQAGNLLTKATWWCAGIFMGLSFVLQLMAGGSRAPRSILEQTFSNPPAGSTAPAPGTAAPAVPLEPAAPTTSPGAAGAGGATPGAANPATPATGAPPISPARGRATPPPPQTSPPARP